MVRKILIEKTNQNYKVFTKLTCTECDNEVAPYSKVMAWSTRKNTVFFSIPLTVADTLLSQGSKVLHLFASMLMLTLSRVEDLKTLSSS